MAKNLRLRPISSFAKDSADGGRLYYRVDGNVRMTLAELERIVVNAKKVGVSPTAMVFNNGKGGISLQLPATSPEIVNI